MHSLFIHPVLISLSVPFLILWHRDMSVGRRSSLRMLECPPVQGSVEDRVTVILTEEIHTIIGRVARCGVNTRPNQGWNVLHVSLLPSCMSPLSPASSSLSVYCIHGELRDIALKTRLVTIRRNILSLNLKIFVKVVRIVRSQTFGHSLIQLLLRTKERKIVNCHSSHSVEQKWSHSSLWN